MNLSNVMFSYEIKDKQFSKINYSFDVLSDTKSSEEVIRSAKTSLQQLETMLDDVYKGSGLKEEDGMIDSTSVDFGYLYSIENGLLSNKKRYSTRLEYTISMNMQGMPSGLTLRLANKDEDQQRLWKIYDSVLALPDIKISNQAQIQLERINFLRAGNFNINTYLALPENTKR